MVHYLFVVLVSLLVTDIAGYWWHRLVAHQGVFRFLPKDYLRQRHHDHHYVKYPINRLVSPEYIQSCEIVFHALAVFIAVPSLIFTVLGWITVGDLLVFWLSAGLYGVLVIGGMHNAYHIERRSLKKWRIMQNKTVWNIFRWLRAYHSIHHKLNANYSILLPVDILFGTYVSPHQAGKRDRENLFPAFDVTFSRGCDLD